MTLVRTLLTLPNPDGTRRPAKGFFIWTPTERRIIEGSPDEVVLPVGFAVELDLTGGFEIDVAATGTDWVWRVDERIEGLRTKTAYVVVPPEGPVDFTDLAPVNTASLRSTAVPDHIWYVYTDYLAEQARLAKVSAANSEAAAMSSVDSAAASALISSTKATESSSSAAAAFQSAGYADADAVAARTSELNAFTHMTAAETAKLAAASAQASAAGHASVAMGARDSAETARDTAVGVELLQVVSGSVDVNGHLILTRYDGTTIDAGQVVSSLSVGQVVTGP